MTNMSAPPAPLRPAVWPKVTLGFKLLWPLVVFFAMSLWAAASMAAPMKMIQDLVFPNDCNSYWDVGNLNESYLVTGPVAQNAYVLACFHTDVAGTGIEGPAADDVHFHINSPLGGSIRIGPPGFHVSIATNGGGAIPQTLGAGNQAGDSFRFEAGDVDIALTMHDGVPLNLGLLIGLLGATVCTEFSDHGVHMPRQAGCPPQIGDPPLPPGDPGNPLQDPPGLPEINNPFRLFPNGGFIFVTNDVPEPGTLMLALGGLGLLRWVRRRKGLLAV